MRQVGLRLAPGSVVASLLLASCALFAPTPYSGRVTGTGDLPLPGVTVSTEDATSVTGPDGTWALATRSGSARLRKPGFVPREVPLPARTVSLAPSGTPVQVAWDDRWAGPPLEGVKGWLGKQGVAIRSVTGGGLPAADVLAVCAPGFFSAQALDAAKDAARQGATLLLAGDWGGASRVDLGALDSIAAPAGIRFVGSLVRDPSAGLDADWLTPEFLVPLPGISGPARLAAAGTLTVEPPASILARSGEASYRISSWERGPQVLAAYGPLGAGKVIAISDASWLTDDKTMDAARPNWQVAGNSALALALVRF